ncbi:MAG: excinuclease ABC subunit B [candidate division WS6 bacterium 34_10]|uniref:UvrABC system protein B n=1 Tax=candidate division WS6 bacterium 34_10 TaxID=1641389 RepID=A0A117M0E5_9BACT|nr:MAG: excinuclease ABC subunit B [candidate division WS6 bacterium 34_10]
MIELAMLENNFQLQSKYKPSEDQKSVIEEISNNLDSGKKKQTLLGVTGSGKTFVMANLVEKYNKPTLVLSHNKTLAAQLYEEFTEFFPENAVKYFVSYYDYYQPESYLPAKDLYIEKESQVNDEIEAMRSSAMNAVLNRSDTLIVASVSCIYNIGNPDNYQNKALYLRRGTEIDLSTLSRELAFMQYERSTYDLERGQFRISGDTVEIYMKYDDFPVRIEFWGNEIDNISRIHPITRQKIEELTELDIFPATALVYERNTLLEAIEMIKRDLKKRVDFLRNIGKDVEAQRLEQKTMYDVEMMASVGYCKSMENYSIYFDGRKPGEAPYTLLDYFPDDYLLLVDESHITIPQVRGMYNGDRARKTNLIEYGFRLPTAYDNRPLNFIEFQKRQGNTVYISATPDEWEIQDSNNTVVELLTRPTGLLDPKIEVRDTKNQIDDVISEIRKNIENKQRVLVTTLTKRMAEDLTEYLQDIDIKVQYLHSDIDTVERVDILRDLRLGKYDVVVGINLLREGIDLPEVSLVIILDADKEGFLRSKTSLVQTIGRSARHVEGRVLMYADKVTDSMVYAIEETKRRRAYQTRYNREHNITPKSIEKEIRDSISKKKVQPDPMVDIDIEKLDMKQKKLLIKDLESKMLLAAENLQFEKAANLRDDIKEIKLKLK